MEWLVGNLTCKMFKLLQMFGLYLSTFILVLIGVDRFLAVRYPIKSLSTPRRCNRLIVFAWVLSAIFSIPQVSQNMKLFIELDYSVIDHVSVRAR